LSGNNVANNQYGIWLDYSSDNNTLSGNNVTANKEGIVLETYSDNNSISGNNITDNNGTGIELCESSNYNIISENTVTNGVCGIWLHSSSNNNSVSGNTFTDAGLSVWDSYSNTVENNTVNGRPLVYLEGMADFSVSDAGQVILVRCDRIRVENLNLSRASFGVQLRETNNSIVSGNNITASNGFAIALDCSSNNSISGNSILNNSNYGILLMSSSNNRISGNNITNDGVGIGLDSSNYNSVSGNNITDSVIGIWLYDTSNNSISGNNIKNNYYGFSFRFSFNNDVFHNDFINNTVQVNDYLEPEQANFWDNGCEGNYWSDYNGTDLDNDGVGDDYLPWEGVDGYPLMNIYWNPCDIDHDLEVNRTDIDISANAFGTRSGDSLWNPHADITGPEQLVSDGKVDMRDISLIAKHYGEHFS
jgi:parallel beta-helix repeat protein